jgi:anti-sigma regulatory factor (Ser/Thr protein kinase)
MPMMIYPAKFECLDEIRDMVLQTARQAGFTEKEIYAIQLSADEAASNIIEHAYEGIADGVIRMTCDVQGGALIITMQDFGKPFDPSKILQPNLKADLSERKIGGLGIYLMRKLMDEVHYESKPGEGNLLTMLKRRG